MEKMAKTIVFLAAAFTSLTGCTSLSPGEIVYQAVHVVDIAQTVRAQTTERGKYDEAGFITKDITGRHPSEASVIEWGAVVSIAHFAVDDYLYSHNHAKLATAFECVSIAFAVDTVYHSYRIGLKYGF